MDEREEDPAVPTDDPRDTGTGAGYAEEHPKEVADDPEGRDPERDAQEPDAPSVSSDEEGDAGQATGNPDAAG
jgi:hypothetical protein